MQNIAEHIVTGFDEELNLLTTHMARMGGMVEAMVTDSINAIKKRDSVLAQSVIDRDHEVNALQVQIDEDAMRIFALRNPMATDLRRVIGAIKVATDLERIGDLAEGIARRALTVNNGEALALTKGVHRMGKLVRTQLKSVLDALLTDDTIKAKQVWLGDSDVDEMYDSLFRELLTFMMEDPRTISSSASLLFAAKNLERIGDHATNIAETVYFITEGSILTLETARDVSDHSNDE